MSNPTQFRHYLIAQDAQGGNIEIVRSSEQVAVLAFDFQRMCFVHCHVLLEGVKNRTAFDLRGRALAEQGHPLLARLVEFGEDDGSFFYITENVDGESLSAFLNRLDRMPIWLAITLASQAVRALLACLERGDYAPIMALESLRVLQTGPTQVQVMLADYRVVEDGGGKAARARLVKSAFDKQSQLLRGYFEERLQEAAPKEEPTLQASDLQEFLGKMLSSAVPGLAKPMTSAAAELEAMTPRPTAVELAAAYKPKPLLAGCLGSFQEVARSVVQSVRIQSQKLDVSQPYAMRGTLIRTGQTVFVEQIPPRRIAGARPSEAVHQVQVLPKAGKFPNLVPVVFVEENEGLECMAESAVEGVALSEVLAARQALQAQETYLVLAGLDTALGQTEKAGIGSRRIRLEDVFLFTGFGKDHPRDSGLLKTKLNEWPGFSIVLRSHACMHAMACRGTDPGMLLPVEVTAKPDVELFWNGGWMAALGCVLIGMRTGSLPAGGLPDKTTDAVGQMFLDELDKARRNNPSSRSAFLGRYARVMQQFDLAQMPGGLWQELSGAPAAPQAQTAEVVRQAPSSPPAKKAPATATTTAPAPAAAPPAQENRRTSRLAPMGNIPTKPTPFSLPPPSPAEETPEIGFAELLIAGPVDEDTAIPEGLRALGEQHQEYQEDYESSWNTLHEEMPFWTRMALLFLLSISVGAILAHISGHAIWQVRDLAPASTTDGSTQTPEKKASAEIEKPAPSPTPPKKTEKPEVPAAPLPNLEVDSHPGRPVPPAPVPTPSSTAVPHTTPPPVPPPDAPPVAAPVSASRAPLTAASVPGPFRDLRMSGVKITPEQRAEALTAAQKGNVDAMVLLGEASLRGESGPMDKETAFHWFDTAAGMNDPEAKRWLAESYMQGWGVAPDDARAVKLLDAAATAGDVESKNLLGYCYASGRGVPQDDAKAFGLFNDAYQAGVAAACSNLGAMYLRGRGTVPDAAKAVALFFEGAKRGNPESMQLYAQALEYGTSVAADDSEARIWYQQAARLGNAEAITWCKKKGVAY